uniref:Mannose receptor C-type 1 n=1 Tax=Pinctada imbricata TaxID=66713 RepID=A0A8U0LSG3_PINIB|nr:mannose receptor C-type 1 [Pinctada imbricata]
MFLCAELFVNRAGIGKWNDVQCWKSRAAVCQAPKSPVFPTQSFSDSRCPTGYTFYGISCYKLNLAPLVRNAAAASCASESASLSSVNSEYEQAFLNVLMRDIEGSYWIGLQKKGSTFEWDNGWTYQYTKWDDNEPSDIKSESCVIIDSGKWNDITCNVKLPSVCQYSLVDPPTTPPPGICPNSTSGYQGYCYFVEITRSKSWVGADAACKEMGMELASVHSQAEVQFIQSYARQISGLQVSPKLWIGLRKDLDASAFEWTDGTPLDFWRHMVFVLWIQDCIIESLSLFAIKRL